MAKRDKDTVDYSRGMPKSNCGNCRYFVSAYHHCLKVQGMISAKMWCKLWEKK